MYKMVQFNYFNYMKKTIYQYLFQCHLTFDHLQKQNIKR